MAAPSRRFAGQEFPPLLVFKIFRSPQGQGSKYISRKREPLLPWHGLDVDSTRGFTAPEFCSEVRSITSSFSLALGEKPTLLIYLIEPAIAGTRVRERKFSKLKMTAEPTRGVMALRCIMTPALTTSNLDESPAYFRGRNNCWRRLCLQNFPGTTIICAIMDYAQSKTLSDRLKKELKFLLLRPQNQELWHD
ncbi:uncharacterized protein CXorf58 homolog [Spheniscus humboldti]